jgi:hypothetical protein
MSGLDFEHRARIVEAAAAAAAAAARGLGRIDIHRIQIMALAR